MRTNDEISAMVLEWACDNHRDWYDATLAVSTKAKAFRTYLLRLVVRRVEEEPKFLWTLPLSILDETDIVRTVKFQGKEIQVGGTNPVSWAQLNLGKDEFGAWLETIDLFDLEKV